MKKVFCLVVFSSFFCFAQAQQDRIATDRPTETNSPSLVRTGAFQLEAGVQDEKTSGSSETILDPDLLLRYGVSNNLELRMEGYLSTHREAGKASATGLEPVEVGIKQGLWKSKKWLPETALYLQTGIPFLASGSRKQDHLSPAIRLLMQNEINKSFSLQYNIGTEWDGSDSRPDWLYSFSPALDLGKHWQAFAELYGFFKRKEAPEHTLDGGLEYFFNQGFACDICSGFGLNKAAPHFFITAGASIRLH